jgi:hypothetical protein
VVAGAVGVVEGGPSAFAGLVPAAKKIIIDTAIRKLTRKLVLIGEYTI